MASENGFVPLSRGIREHLKNFPDSALKLYLSLLVRARFAGPKKGTCVANFSELSEELDMGQAQMQRAANWLRGKYVDYQKAPNQNGITRWTILKYKGMVSDFAPIINDSSSDRSDDRSTEGAPKEHRRSAPSTDMNPQELSVPHGVFMGYSCGFKNGEEEPPSVPPWDTLLAIARAGFFAKRGQDPSWSQQQVGELLGLVERKKDLTEAEFSRRWQHYLGSTETFTVSQGLSLGYFCKFFDRFQDGPQEGNNGTGKRQSGPTRAERADAAFARAVERDRLGGGIAGLAPHLRRALPKGSG